LTSGTTIDIKDVNTSTTINKAKQRATNNKSGDNTKSPTNILIILSKENHTPY
jgi:hypothetical protein